MTTPPSPTVAEMLATLDAIMERHTETLDGYPAATTAAQLRTERRHLRTLRAIVATLPTDPRGRPLARQLAATHLGDPTTSQAGADATRARNGTPTGLKAGSLSHAVLQAAAAIDRLEPTPPGSTTLELADYIGRPRNEVAKRVTDAKAAGYLEPCGIQSADDSPTATPQQRWRLTDAGWDTLHRLDRQDA